MGYEEAVNVILMHGIGRDDVPIAEALLPNGFLSVLRPFAGLREENFLDVINAVVALGPHLVGQCFWERRLVEGLWELTKRARMWALDPNSMLQRNRLLSTVDSRRLQLWVDCIEMAVSRLFRGGDPAEALTYYRECEPSL